MTQNKDSYERDGKNPDQAERRYCHGRTVRYQQAHRRAGRSVPSVNRRRGDRLPVLGVSASDVLYGKKIP